MGWAGGAAAYAVISPERSIIWDMPWIGSRVTFNGVDVLISRLLRFLRTGKEILE